MVYMKIKCDNCGHGWDYQGKTQWYLACPKCKSTTNISELTEKDRNKAKWMFHSFGVVMSIVNNFDFKYLKNVDKVNF